MQRRQAATISEMNTDLTVANEYLATVSMKIARYLPPQIYRSIFSGERDATIQTEQAGEPCELTGSGAHV